MLSSCLICGDIATPESSSSTETIPEFLQQLVPHVQGDGVSLEVSVCELCRSGVVKEQVDEVERNVKGHQHKSPEDMGRMGGSSKGSAEMDVVVKSQKSRHTVERPYKCHLCHRAYKRREALIAHLLGHSAAERS